jgi:hypothetical protein
VATALALGAGGCAAHHHATDDDVTLLAQDGSDTSASENDAETISSSFIAAGGRIGLASGSDLAGGQLTTANLGDAMRAQYLPAGCLNVVADPAGRGASYEFDHCNGPYGLLEITGTIQVTLTPPATAAGPIVLDYVGTDLRVNRATVDYAAHSEIKSTDTSRMMTWRGQLTGTTARGRTFRRTNQKVVSWTVGQECVLVNGFSDGDVNGRAVHTDVIGYSRCKGQCPAAGSEIRITSAESGKTVDVRYDGGSSATFTAPNGTQTKIVLACGL